MKKLLLTAAASVFLLAACNDDKPEEKKEAEKAPATEEKTDVKADLMNYYFSISKTINEVDQDLNKYENAAAKDKLPEGEELQKMKDAAKTSAENTVKKIESLELPKSLEPKKDDLSAAVNLVKESYQMKADALAKEGEVVLDDANAKFTEADDALNKLLEKEGLNKSSLINEVSK